MSPVPTPPPSEPAPSLRPVEESDLAELRRLYEHSTPGVWKLWAMELLADQDGTSNVDTAVPIANFFTRDEKGSPRTWDADFCRVAHNLTPSLLDRLRAAEETQRRVEALCVSFDPTSGSGRARAFVNDVRAALAEGASR